MKVNMYAVYDAKAAVFQKPFFFANDDVAMRAFAGIMANPDDPMARFPEDFVLHEVGSWDDDLGAVIGVETPRSIANGLQAQHYFRQHAVDVARAQLGGNGHVAPQAE